jgi:hypothetical protein
VNGNFKEIPMTHFRTLPTLALATLAILPLGTIGCSQGSHSPTEPAPLTETSTLSAASANSLSSVTAESHGADDTQPDDNGGRNGNSGSGKGGGKAPKAPKAPRGGQEFEGAVRSVGAGSVTLASGVRVTVNAQTQWVARGDLFSLSQVSASLAARRSPRVEGRGTRQSDGSILAASIKAEER